MQNSKIVFVKFLAECINKALQNLSKAWEKALQIFKSKLIHLEKVKTLHPQSSYTNY